MTNEELKQMLISKCNRQTEQITCLKIELEEAEAVARAHKSDYLTAVQALNGAKGGLQVRKQNQGTVENLRLAVEGLLTAPTEQHDAAVEFALKIMSLTETEVSF